MNDIPTWIITHSKASAVDGSLELRLFIVHKMQKLRNHTSLGNYSTRLRFSYDIVHSFRLTCTSRAIIVFFTDAPQKKTVNGTKSVVHYIIFIISNIIDPDSGQHQSTTEWKNVAPPFFSQVSLLPVLGCRLLLVTTNQYSLGSSYRSKPPSRMRPR